MNVDLFTEFPGKNTVFIRRGTAVERHNGARRLAARLSTKAEIGRWLVTEGRGAERWPGGGSTFEGKKSTLLIYFYCGCFHVYPGSENILACLFYGPFAFCLCLHVYHKWKLSPFIFLLCVFICVFTFTSEVKIYLEGKISLPFFFYPRLLFYLCFFTFTSEGKVFVWVFSRTLEVKIFLPLFFAHFLLLYFVCFHACQWSGYGPVGVFTYPESENRLVFLFLHTFCAFIYVFMFTGEVEIYLNENK